ncbi:reverse transcriptase domain-containing protein [Tanacetum coccineum]
MRGDPPPLTRKETLNFVIVNFDSPYDMLLGRTAMQKMEIVVSTIHGAIKFHTTRGIDVFTWTHADMTGIPRTIIVKGKSFNTEHKLNAYNHVKPIKQKRKGLGPDRNTAACKKVGELMKARILRDVKHQTWVANPVMQRLVDKVFHDQRGRNLEAYVDDMVIKRTSDEEMLAYVKETFEKFRSINMKLNPKKSSFGVEEGPFLGHLITKK